MKICLLCSQINDQFNYRLLVKDKRWFKMKDSKSHLNTSKILKPLVHISQFKKRISWITQLKSKISKHRISIRLNSMKTLQTFHLKTTMSTTLLIFDSDTKLCTAQIGYLSITWVLKRQSKFTLIFMRIITLKTTPLSWSITSLLETAHLYRFLYVTIRKSIMISLHFCFCPQGLIATQVIWSLIILDWPI